MILYLYFVVRFKGVFRFFICFMLVWNEVLREKSSIEVFKDLCCGL